MTGLKLQTCEELGANVEFEERRLFSLKQNSQLCSGKNKGKVESMFVSLLTRLTHREKVTKLPHVFLNKELHLSHFVIT